MSIDQPLTLTLQVLNFYSTAITNQRSVKIDDMLSEMFEKTNLDNRSRRIVYARTMDVIRRWNWAQTLVNKKLSRKCPIDVYHLLLIGTTEICYPPRSSQKTINQMSNYAKKFHPKFGSFVYGVLKNIERLTPVSYESHCPSWIEDQLHYPDDQKKAILDAWMIPPTLFIRINPWRITESEFNALLTKSEIKSKQGAMGWHILSPISVKNIPGYHDGLFYVQDEHAAMVDHWFKELHGTLWDACAAPGGKTLASLAFDNIKTFASDSSAKRLRILDNNIRLAKPKYKPAIAHIDINQSPPSEPWDAILLDVPCSGSGVFSKHPEKKWLFDPLSLSELTNTQAQLLQNAWEKLAPMGELLYMTCSVLHCENEDQIRSFMQKNSNAKLLSIDSITSDTSCGSLLLPNAGWAGGFYMARLQKTNT